MLKRKQEAKPEVKPEPKMSVGEAIAIAAQLRVDQGKDKLIEFLEKLK